VAALNLVGLKRRGFERQQVNDLRAAFKKIFLDDSGSLVSRLDNVAAAYADAPLVHEVVQFMRADDNRGFSLPSRN
jgi:UDP-N-acetylglucosamine acyltransferase